MSENYQLYPQKMEQRRVRRIESPLRNQLDELLAVVRDCEATWALEERIERGR